MTSVTSTELSDAPPTSEIRVPSIFQRASDFGTASARPTSEAPCTLEGYVGVYWTRLPGYRIPTDDKKIRTLRNHCFKLEKSTTSSVDHMKEAHGIDEEGPLRKKARHGVSAMGQYVQNGGDPVTAAQNEQALEFHHADFKAIRYD
ncbi:hypothetical protein LTR32_007575 [Rachicladosporium monterosium]|uniref:Uncharacterized protein n=1 Tax=Rachicladosporium monterosium TaxID=1507873 RepID=A0ABR0KX57_9PEZI|nr:hypothetical protein LTR32_007575 [Rachicladosporium monterosium]